MVSCMSMEDYCNNYFTLNIAVIFAKQFTDSDESFYYFFHKLLLVY